jgi:hypothetical protein
VTLHQNQASVARAFALREDLGAEALVQKLIGYLEEAEHGIEIAKGARDLQGLARCLKEARETAVYIGKMIGLWSDPRAATIIDNRRQTLNVGNLTTDELRNLARLAPGKPEAIEAEFRDAETLAASSFSICKRPV